MTHGIQHVFNKELAFITIISVLFILTDKILCEIYVYLH